MLGGEATNTNFIVFTYSLLVFVIELEGWSIISLQPTN
jgi:hypothetical protein